LLRKRSHGVEDGNCMDNLDPGCYISKLEFEAVMPILQPGLRPL
jgi:hypothetical protein